MMLDVSYTMSEDMMLAMAYVMHGPHKANLYDEENDVLPQIIPWLVKDHFSTKDTGTQESAAYVSLMQSDDPLKHTFAAMDMLLLACPMFVLLCPQIVTMISQEDEIHRTSSSEYHAEIAHRTLMQRMASVDTEHIMLTPSPTTQMQWIHKMKNTTPGGFRHRIEAEVYLAGDGRVRTVYKFRPTALDHFYVEHYEDVEQSLESYMGEYVSQVQLGKILPPGKKVHLARLSDLEELDEITQVFITKRTGGPYPFTVQILRRLPMLKGFIGSPAYSECRYDLEDFVLRIYDLRRLDGLIAEANLMLCTDRELDDDDYITLTRLYDLYDELEIYREDYKAVSKYVWRNLKKDCGHVVIEKEPIGVCFKPSGHGVYTSYWDRYTTTLLSFTRSGLKYRKQAKDFSLNKRFKNDLL